MPVRCGMQRTTALCVMAAVVMATTLVRAQTPDNHLHRDTDRGRNEIEGMVAGGHL